MRFATWVFLVAGAYGLVTLAPLYFLEGAIGRVSPAITHPEYFYGYLSAAMVFQVMFLVISRDPARFRPFMVVAMLEKFTWLAALWTLAAQGRVIGSTLAIGSVDFVWGVLFVVAYIRTKPAAA
ncbi:MAG: hypothetical protein E7812_17255 [Phenylobacterium sp.]|nr:MAG: hypothetical protein E7812_17255 [Phenylobacterium sp.]